MSKCAQSSQMYPNQEGCSSEKDIGSHLAHLDKRCLSLFKASNPSRHRSCLLQMATFLRKQRPGSEADDHLSIVEAWALKHGILDPIGIEDTKALFMGLWEAVDFSRQPLERAYQRSLEREPPTLPEKFRTQPVAVKLARLMRELQAEHPDEPFKLAERAAAVVLGGYHRTTIRHWP